MGNAQNKVQFYSNDCPWILLLRRESNTFCVDNIMLAKIWFSINNGNWTKWSAICAEIICVISNSNEHAAWVHSVSSIWNHKYDFRPKLHDTRFNYHFITSILKSPKYRTWQVQIFYCCSTELVWNEIHPFFFFGGGGKVRVLETKVAKFATWYSLSFIFLQFDQLL